MSVAGQRLIEGVTEALAVSRGEIPAARIHHQGHSYVPEDRWEPISTAPHDVPILAFNTRLAMWPPVVVAWKEPEGEAAHWADAATSGGDALYFNSHYFDLWQPLPAPPRRPQQ